jgi:hypothetical protein
LAIVLSNENGMPRSNFAGTRGANGEKQRSNAADQDRPLV